MQTEITNLQNKIIAKQYINNIINQYDHDSYAKKLRNNKTILYTLVKLLETNITSKEELINPKSHIIASQKNKFVTRFIIQEKYVIVSNEIIATDSFYFGTTKQVKIIYSENNENNIKVLDDFIINCLRYSCYVSN